LLGLVLATSGVFLLDSPALAEHVSATTSSPPTVARGTVLTDTTLGTETQIQQIDMVSASLAYAVASRNNYSTNWLYLVISTDGAKSWRVAGALPVAPFVGQEYLGIDLTLNFLTSSLGYVQESSGPIYVTVDAGETWSLVITPGISPTMVASASRVVITSDLCHGKIPYYGPLKCPSELSTYALGATHATSTYPIPSASGVGPWRAAITLAAPSTTSAVVAENDTQPDGPPGVLATVDAGKSWRQVDNPCPQLLLQQILVTRGRWLAYCYLGGGMDQGTSGLWSSTNTGTSWTPVNRANEGGNYRGDIGDIDQTIYAGTSRLYSALGGAGGGFTYSDNGGQHWTPLHLPTYFGGGTEFVSTFAASGVVLGEVGGPIYEAIDGTHFVRIGSLPLGRYLGVDLCRANTGTTAHLGEFTRGVAPQSFTAPIVFTNTSNTPCYLDAVPLVQPEVGHEGASQIVTTSALTIGGRDGFVYLKARGGTASATFEVLSTSQFPSVYCAPALMTSLSVLVYPSARFQVPTPAVTICTGEASTRNAGVVAGVVNDLVNHHLH
jgi:photosystem II stability/assembly factor-like uncharacterized protein